MSPGPWRVGRKVGRTIYDANDRLIGVMDTVEDAALAAAAWTLLDRLRQVSTRCGCCGGCDDCREDEALIALIDGAPAEPTS